MPPRTIDHVILRTILPFKAMIKNLNAKKIHDIVESGLMFERSKHVHCKITLLDEVKFPQQEYFYRMTKAFINNTLSWFM